MYLTYNQVKSVLSNAGFKGINLEAALKICYCESNFNKDAHNTSGEDSRGLMQINVSDNANPQFKHLNLFDPQINANVAFEIFTMYGKNFNAWTCARTLKLTNPLNNILLPLFAIGLSFVMFAIVRK